MAIRVAAVIVAGGRGTRTGMAYPKQYRALNGAPIVRDSIRSFAAHPQVDLVQPVIHADDAERFAAADAGTDPGEAGSRRRHASGLGARGT